MKYFLIGLFAVGALLTINSIDEPKNPTTKGSAMFVVIVDALIIIGIVKFL
jgi:hypothetical protein